MIRIIGGKQKGLKLKTPKGSSTRPTQEKLRKSLFDILQFTIEGANFLDVFAGSGAIGIEALSRGANSSTFIDNDQKAAQCIRDNLASCKLKGVIRKGDALKVLNSLEGPFDFIYIDPPYHMVDKVITPILEIITEKSLLRQRGTIFIESSSQEKWEEQHLPGKLVVEKKRTFGSSTLLQIFLPD